MQCALARLTYFGSIMQIRLKQPSSLHCPLVQLRIQPSVWSWAGGAGGAGGAGAAGGAGGAGAAGAGTGAGCCTV